MAEQDVFEIVVRGRDEASRVLGGVAESHAALAAAAGRSDTELARLDATLVRASRSARALAIPLVAELVPGLGAVSRQAVGVIAAAATLGTGLGAVAIAAVGLAGIVGGQLVAAWQKNREEMLNFDRAVRSLDMSRIGAEAGKARLELEGLREELEDVERQLKQIEARRAQGAPLPLGMRERRTGEAEELRRRRDELQGRVQVAGELGAADQLTRDQSAAAQLQEQNRLALRGAFDFKLSSQARQIAELERRAEDLALGRGGAPDVAAAATVRRQIQALRTQADLDMRQQTSLALATTTGAGEFGGYPENVEALAAEITKDLEAAGVVRFDARARMTPRELREDEVRTDRERAGLLGPATTGEHLGVPTDEEAAAFRADTDKVVLDLRRQTLELDRDRVAILREQHGLTEGERAALDVLVIERGRLVTLSDRRLTTEQRANVELAAQVQTASVLRAELERTDAVSGARAGIRQIAEEWTAAGRAMEGVTLSTAHNIQNALARTLRGESVGKQFADAMMGTLTNALASWMTGTFARVAGGFLPGGAGASPLAVSAGAAGLDVTGASPAALASLVQGGAKLVGGAGGRTYALPPVGGRGYIDPITGAPITSVQMMPGDPQYAAAAAAYEPDMFGYGAYGANAAAGAAATGSFWNTPMYTTQGPSGGYIAGATYGTAATYGLAGAGAALAAYGIYQGSASGYRTSYTEAAIYGGVTGAVAGASIGALIGTAAAPGIGTAVGAVVGLALGLAGANISQGKYKKAHARAQRNRDAATIANGIQAALSEAETVSIPDILARRLASGNTVGGVLLAIANHMGETELIAYLVDYGAAVEGFNYERLGSIGELVAYIQPEGVRQLLDFALDIFRREFDRERGILVGQEQVVTRAGTRATLQTLTPLTARANLQPGRDTFLEQQPGQSDADLERFLFRLASIDDDRDLRILRRDDNGLVFSRTVRA